MPFLSVSCWGFFCKLPLVSEKDVHVPYGAGLDFPKGPVGAGRRARLPALHFLSVLANQGGPRQLEVD